MLEARIPSFKDQLINELRFAVGTRCVRPIEFNDIKTRRVRIKEAGTTIRRIEYFVEHGIIEPSILMEIRKRAIKSLKSDLTQIGEEKTAERIIFNGNS